MQLNPAEGNPVNVADWVELEALYSDDGSFSFEALRSQIDTDGTLFEEEAERGQPDMLPHERSEGVAASALLEIDRRSVIAGRAYPFDKRGGLLQLRPHFRRCIPYIFCLLAADRDSYDRADTRLPMLFEHLTREALAEYLGGNAVRFGTPRDTMPRGINDAITELSRLTGATRVGVFPVNATDNDLGLDVVAWKDFPDRYISKVEVYMQCGTGEDWRCKKHDCDLAKWQAVLMCSNDRLKGLAIPYVVADERMWRREAWGVLFMDRLRIASVLRDKKLPDDKYHWWRWCDERITAAREPQVKT